MSHFATAVFLKDPADLEAVLAPFNEQPGEGSPFLRFVDCTEEVGDKWADPTTTFGDWCKKDKPERVGKHVKDVYKDKDEFAKGWFGYTQRNGRWGYWDNPNAKWDWWVIGGRWMGSLIVPASMSKSDIIHGEPGTMMEPTPERVIVDGKACWRVDGCRVGCLDFGAISTLKATEAGEHWDKAKAAVDERIAKIKSGECHRNVSKTSREQAMADAEAKGLFCFAALTLDGKWMQRGNMGWWGMDDSTKESTRAHYEAFRDYITSIPEDTWIIFVDCHI